ncbi:ABC transporter substrate-binding protein [Psychromonas sp. SR45-3]|uniref:ABC transporter substrate-binding protein n=1 Tax=Psychromonas sp. SR45-3 TaxID=2760930 RepID=UPI0015FE53C7|nr:ABC transporter substrate-binding protein [Psychromonas sp. SR45-3]MBB1272481.1 ABC transporter substrate-binding protein [Psychromonas sp. SR45-3]
MRLRWFFITSIFYAVGCFAQNTNVFNPQAITVAVDKIPTSFNPFADQKLIEEQFKHLLFDPLFRWDQQQQLEARLVKNWKRINNKTIRFYLRKNVHFHSGNILTAKDVIWSFEQAKNNAKLRFFNKIETITSNDSNSFDIRSELSEIQLLDDLTNLFVLDSAFYQSNKRLLDTPPSIILPPITQLTMSGTGPYLVQKYNPVLGVLVIANNNYWEGALPTKFFRFMRVNKPQSRLFALLANDVQVSYAIPNKFINDLAENTATRLVQVPSSNAIFLAINDQLSPILSDKKVREAIHMAINQPGMLKYILKDNGQIHPSVMAFTDNSLVQKEDKNTLLMPEYNLEKAKQILQIQPLPKQMSLLVMLDDVGNTSKVADALTHMLDKIGVNLVVQEVSSQDVWDNTNLYYDFALSSWQTNLMSKDNIYEDLFKNSFLTGYLENKFKQQKIAENFQSQASYFQKLQQDNWIFPLFYQDKIWAQNNQFNLQDIFSSNGIPYWSLFKVNKDSTLLNQDG